MKWGVACGVWSVESGAKSRAESRVQSGGKDKCGAESGACSGMEIGVGSEVWTFECSGNQLES